MGVLFWRLRHITTARFGAFRRGFHLLCLDLGLLFGSFQTNFIKSKEHWCYVDTDNQCYKCVNIKNICHSRAKARKTRSSRLIYLIQFLALKKHCLESVDHINFFWLSLDVKWHVIWAVLRWRSVTFLLTVVGLRAYFLLWALSFVFGVVWRF